MSVVLQQSTHKLPTKGAVKVEHTFKSVDGRTAPSEEAIKRIVARYDSWVREIEKREREDAYDRNKISQTPNAER